MPGPVAAPLRRFTITVRDALRLVREASPSAWRITVALAVGAALVPPVMVWLGKQLVDLVVDGAQEGASARTVVPTVIALGIVGAAFRTLSAIQTNRQELFSYLVEFHAEQQLLRRVAEADLAYFASLHRASPSPARGSRSPGWSSC
jgi:hypothetical protein